MFCCLHSSFLGELTFVTAFIYQCNNAGFLHLSPLPSVQGKSLFHFVGTPPKIIIKIWLSRFANLWQGHGSSIHEKLITAVP